MKKLLACAVLALPLAGFAADRQVLLQVDGMDCPACGATITRSLERLDRVQVVSIDTDSGAVVVAVADDIVTEADLIDAVANAGYAARVRESFQ
jgi:copper chaperone CopZ